MKRTIKTIATLIVAALLALSMFACTAAPAAPKHVPFTPPVGATTSAKLAVKGGQ